MNIFTAEQLTKAFNEKPLFTNLDISLSEGQKMALIAANGSGKTTLLKIIAGRETPDSGKVSYRSDLKIGYLEQDPLFVKGASIMDCIFEPSHPVLHAIGEYERLIELGENADPNEFQKVMDVLDSMNGWDYESRAAEVLGRLGIHDLAKKVEEMSGGQRKRIALARLLIEDHDLLLLDEPTNHLDLDMIEWLENYIKRLNKSILLISHDRYFLDQVCDTIAEIDQGKIFTYNGNYAYFLERKEERELQERSTIDKAKNTYRKELEWMRRQPKARTTKSKSRQDSFYEVEEVAKSKRTESKMQMTMQMNRLGSKILELEKDELYRKYKDRVGEVISGEVYQIWKKEIMILDDEGNELLLPKTEMIPADHYKKGDAIKAVVLKVEMYNGSPRILLSRIAPVFLERLFEMEVPEIIDGIIAVKKIVREPGERAKVAVESFDDRIDPVGACVGMKGSRIHGIVRELRNENIDVINFTSNLQLLIQRALSPAKVSSIKLDEESRRAAVYLKPDQVSLAIGKGGHNIKLAGKLAGMEIDVYRESDEDEGDIDLDEFADEIDSWILDEFKNIGCDTARSVLNLTVADLVRRTELEEETVNEVRRILQAEFE